MEKQDAGRIQGEAASKPGLSSGYVGASGTPGWISVADTHPLSGGPVGGTIYYCLVAGAGHEAEAEAAAMGIHEGSGIYPAGATALARFSCNPLHPTIYLVSVVVRDSPLPHRLGNPRRCVEWGG